MTRLNLAVTGRVAYVARFRALGDDTPSHGGHRQTTHPGEGCFRLALKARSRLLLTGDRTCG